MGYRPFGLATDAYILKTHCGTPLYAAPEIWSGVSYTVAVDIWSLGVIPFQYAYGLPKYGRKTFSGNGGVKCSLKQSMIGNQTI